MSAPLFTLYGDRRSGNCLKIVFAADLLGLDYRFVDVDIMAGESRTPEFLAINPAGQVPAVDFGGGRTLAQSNAVLIYLAEGSTLLPADAFQRAKVLEWLFWEQYSHEPYVAVCRFQMLYQGKRAEERESWRVEKAEAALDYMERRLAESPFLVGTRLTIADISLLAYTRLAGEGGLELSGRPNLTAWIPRCETELGLAEAA
ncbi:glutathione S-transferase family protein [Nisaea acidiphila]|uniref:Glutathione S-transferase family protein n=1 Tax=Nisaea acidiphila TaxID=1862145 RepID=A0A9J7B248_9PROT|nr:glutathione S-transferase family protein [Nisaea acidiphila]UUX51741.1 glutathione S-transferase family protein [Nisaea acidiphila]